jgi:branched-chain amino acid transport system permease protein
MSPPPVQASFRIAALIMLGLATALPWLVSEYRLFQFTQVWILAIAMLGLNLLTGWCGQISLGHGAFFALGAYCSAILMQGAGLPDWLTLPACAALGFGAGWLFGLPAARLEGLYLALASFALAVALPQVLKHPGLAPLTGGSNGLVLDPARAPAFWPGSAEHWIYTLALIVLVIAIVLTHRLARGQAGRAMRALRDHPIAAGAIGVNAAALKAQVFGISAMFAGIAGGLSAIAVRYVGPDSFDMFLSISLLVGIVVGGLASIPGSLLGALFVQFVPHTAEQVSREAAWAIYGVFLLIALWAMPGGVASLVTRLRPSGFTDSAKSRPS